ncbi:MAG: cation-translocating P-type ATPase [Microthrixaceae bacterium]
MEEEGLTGAEAARRLAADGPNVLPPPPRPSALRRLLRPLVEFFALMLWVGAALAFLAGLPQLGVAVILVVVLNGLFAFAQEYRADRAAERLVDLLPHRATVVRGGRSLDVDAAELVVGDVVLLEAGDRVSADLTVRHADALMVDTSMLTGESAPVPMAAGARVHAGTFVVEGEAHTEVTATGSATRLAGLADLTRTGDRPTSPLARELQRLVRIIGTAAVTLGVGLFAVSQFVGLSLSEGFVFGIGVTVALVPEAMLPTVTLSLAVGAERLAARRALVRRLESVETLGSVTFICTDKTGTLTTNEMTVVRVWTPTGIAVLHGPGFGPVAEVAVDGDRAPVVALGRAAARCSTGDVELEDGAWRPVGDVMEAALVALALRLGLDPDEDRAHRPDLRRYPFDPRRRRMSVVAGRPDGSGAELLVKGGPDAVLGRCRGDTAAARAEVERMAGHGLRTLAVARRDLDAVPAADVAAAEAEVDLDLLGLVGLEDPPRPGVGAALADCRRAGIRVAMVTGDHPATARSIAEQVGLAPVGAVEVVEGAELPEDGDALGELLDRDGLVLARIEPEDKLRIARALQARGHVVAMTGDGVNDGPALQQADIGVAMGRTGTDVAREASDLVLLDEDFAVIVRAVELGRATYANIGRFLTYHLTANVAELAPFVVWALSGGRFPLIIGVLQVIGIDIGTDTLPAVALGAEQPAPHTLERPPARGHLLNRTVAWRAFGLLGPTEVVLSFLAYGVTCWGAGWRPGDGLPSDAVLLTASGAAFATIVAAQLTNAFVCRSSLRFPWQLGWTSNPYLVWAVLAEVLLVGALLFVPVIASAMGQAPPTAWGWSVVVLAVPVMLAVDALWKLPRRNRRRVADAVALAGPP